MGLSANARAFTWSDGLTVAAQDLRLSQTGLLLSGLGAGASVPLGIGSGVRDGTGFPLQVNIVSGLSVSVNTGMCAIQGSAAANTGAYGVTLDTAATLTCNAANPTQPRIDSVCMTVTDLGTSGSTAVVQIITGTPASSPTAPTLPSNSLLLCNMTVPAGATTLTSGNLSDMRTFQAAAGGITPVLHSSLYPTSGGNAMYIHDNNLGRLKRWSSAAAAFVAPSTAAFAPTSAGPANASVSSSTPVTIVSASVTVDGYTNVKVSLTWAYVATSSTAAGNSATILCVRGSTQVGSGAVVTTQNANGQISGGSTFSIDPTPSAGTYTYSWTIANQGAGTFAPHSCTIYIEAQPG